MKNISVIVCAVLAFCMLTPSFAAPQDLVNLKDAGQNPAILAEAGQNPAILAEAGQNPAILAEVAQISQALIPEAPISNKGTAATTQITGTEEDNVDESKESLATQPTTTKLENIVEITDKADIKKYEKSEKDLVLMYYMKTSEEFQKMEPELESLFKENPDITLLRIERAVDWSWMKIFNWGSPTFIFYKNGKRTERVMFRNKLAKVKKAIQHLKDLPSKL